MCYRETEGMDTPPLPSLFTHHPPLFSFGFPGILFLTLPPLFSPSDEVLPPLFSPPLPPPSLAALLGETRCRACESVQAKAPISQQDADNTLQTEHSSCLVEATRRFTERFL